MPSSIAASGSSTCTIIENELGLSWRDLTIQVPRSETSRRHRRNSPDGYSRRELHHSAQVAVMRSVVQPERVTAKPSEPNPPQKLSGNTLPSFSVVDARVTGGVPVLIRIAAIRSHR